MSSSVARAKRLAGVSRSAQTLGIEWHVSRFAIASRGHWPRRHGFELQCCPHAPARTVHFVLALRNLLEHTDETTSQSYLLGICARAPSLSVQLRPSHANSLPSHRASPAPLPQALGEDSGRPLPQAPEPKPQQPARPGNSRATPITPGQVALPNPSLERTRTGMALGPRGAHCHHSPHGPSAFPASAPQLKR